MSNKQIIPGVPAEPSHGYPITLDGIVYTPVQTWRDRTQSWYLDLYDSSGALIAGGRRLSPGRYPVHVFGLDIPGEFIVGGSDGFERYDLGVQGGLTLEYVPAASLPTGDTTAEPVGVLEVGEPPDPEVGTNGSGVPLEGTILESLTVLGLEPDGLWSGDGDNEGHNLGEVLTDGMIGEGSDPRDLDMQVADSPPSLRNETKFGGFPFFRFDGLHVGNCSLASSGHFWDTAEATVVIVFNDSIVASDPDPAVAYFDVFGGVYFGRIAAEPEDDATVIIGYAGAGDEDHIIAQYPYTPGSARMLGYAWENTNNTFRTIYGNQVSNLTGAGPVIGSDDTMHIGGNIEYAAANYVRDFGVAFIAVWLRPLTAEEIAKVYELAVYRCHIEREDAPYIAPEED